MSTWHVYLLRCRDSSLYTGCTKDRDTRIAAPPSNSESYPRKITALSPFEAYRAIPSDSFRVLHFICTNVLLPKAQVAASYRHFSSKILTEMPQVLEKVSMELSQQKKQLQLSVNSPVDNPVATLESCNRQFQLKEQERQAVINWVWPQEAGDTMYHVVNTYTKPAKFEGLPAESSHRLQSVGGNVPEMLAA